MSKGSRRRPCQIPTDQAEANWEAAFGPRPLPTVMSEDDRREAEQEKELLNSVEGNTDGPQE